MLAADIDPATRAIRDGGWGERRTSLGFFVSQPHIYPFVADADGAIVGTSIATHNGAVGWIGLVFVAPSMRGLGLGGGLTVTAVNALQERGCRSALLAATELGERVYARLGFRTVGEYALFEGPRGDRPPDDDRLRRLTTVDLDAVCKLDRAASGEDRSGALRALAAGWVIDNAGGVEGFALHTSLGFGPAIATRPENGRVLLDVLRSDATEPRLILTLPSENAAGAAHLRESGFVEQRRLPRMLLGEPVDWQPRQVWAIFNFAMG